VVVAVAAVAVAVVAAAVVEDAGDKRKEL